MRWGLSLVITIAVGCGGPAPTSDADARPSGPALEVPPVIALPYVAAGAGPSMLSVTVANPGTAAIHAPGGGALAWMLTGDPAFAIVAAPDSIDAGGEATLTIQWTGSATPQIAGASLTVVSEAGPRAAEVWGVAGDPALEPAAFTPVTGAGGVTIVDSAIVHMPTAPFPAPGRTWMDDRVHLFVPADFRERDAQDLVVHFHGHNTTIDQTVPAHAYREQLYASGVDAILVVPQGPVNAASGDFGKLMTPDGTAAFLDEVITVLYRAGVITRPVLGRLTLTSHSGGYQVVAQNLGGERFQVDQVDLFDSLYGYSSTYRDFALSGAIFRSDYTAGGGTQANNLALAMQLTQLAQPVATAATQAALRDAAPVIYFAASTHEGSTRIDAAYAEQLRWASPHARRGPRAELRTATAANGTASITWLAPHDDDVTGWRVETSDDDGATWTTAVQVPADAAVASFPIDAAVRVRLAPIVTGLAPDAVQASDTYRVAPAADVLIVDGFDRVIDGSWGQLAHDFAARVGGAVGDVHTIAHAAITDDGFALAGYREVIWLCGDESTDDHTFTTAERAAVDAYLAGGGHLIVSGSEIGYELGPTSASSWLASAFGASYASDDAGANSIHTTNASVTADFGDASAPYTEEFPDSFATTGAGAVVLAYDTGAPAAVGIAGRAVIVGFPLETIADPAALAAVVADLRGFAAP
ncbi:MAG: hypothetical protein K8W52_39400 [Deltaproteobacteria bacterium]|nr:hypothetical protein [Deltaproteobacteria bacterium]